VCSATKNSRRLYASDKTRSLFIIVTRENWHQVKLTKRRKKDEPKI
jgi:hypothetical protein